MPIDVVDIVKINWLDPAADSPETLLQCGGCGQVAFCCLCRGCGRMIEANEPVACRPDGHRCTECDRRDPYPDDERRRVLDIVRQGPIGGR